MAQSQMTLANSPVGPFHQRRYEESEQHEQDGEHEDIHTRGAESYEVVFPPSITRPRPATDDQVKVWWFRQATFVITFG